MAIQQHCGAAYWRTPYFGQAVPIVLRGGSWNNNSNNAACAYRNNEHPDNTNNNIGFRCAKTSPVLSTGEHGRKAAVSDGVRVAKVKSRPHVRRRSRFEAGQRRSLGRGLRQRLVAKLFF